MGMIDFNLLEAKFKVGLHKQENAIYSICAADLIQRETYGSTYVPLIKAEDLSAAATYFCSAFSTAAVALQYTVSAWNKALDLSLSNITLQIYPVDKYYRFVYVLKQSAAVEVPTEKEARITYLHSLFVDFYGHTLHCWADITVCKVNRGK